MEWKRGEKADGSDSYAEQIVDDKHWPELVDVIGLATYEKKKVSSRAGMKQTIQTSTLYPARVKNAENSVDAAIKAIKSKDFNALAEIIMRDSNDMHAVMLDTWPPITYLNDISREVISAVHGLNESEGKNVAAYTFDAGPHPQIITTSANVERVKKLLNGVEGMKEVIVSKTGRGPRMLDESKSLIDEKKLIPK